MFKVGDKVRALETIYGVKKGEVHTVSWGGSETLEIDSDNINTYFCTRFEKAGDPLFIVWGPAGSTNPKIQYNNLASAQIAAEDITRKHPNEKFYVMEARGVAEMNDVVWKDL
jgi:hypothetical protein